MFFRKKYMEWKEYKSNIDFLDIYNWQQKVRRDNIKNL